MPDVQWSNEPLPPAKPGLSTPVKVAIGCGLLMLLAGGACVVATLAGVTKITSAVSTAGDAEWPIIKQVSDQLATEAGAKAVWAAHPKLSMTFTDQDDFLREMARVRPYLEPMPDQRPGLMSGKLSMDFKYNGDQSSVIAGYQTRLGPRLIFTFENHELVNIQLATAPPSARGLDTPADVPMSP